MQVCQNWGSNDDGKKTSVHDDSRNGEEGNAQKESEGPTLEEGTRLKENDPDNTSKDDLQTFKKDLGRNADQEALDEDLEKHETQVKDHLLLENEDDQGGNEGDCQNNCNKRQAGDQDHQGDQDRGNFEDEDPRRARLSGLSLTLGRGAVPRALRRECHHRCPCHHCRDIIVTFCTREESVSSPSLARSPAMHEGFHIRDWKVITMVIMVMTRTMMTMMIFFTDLFLSRTVLFFSLVDAFITMPYC